MSPNYRFPSQIKADLSEIEKPLRRKKPTKLKLLDWFFILIFLAALTFLGVLVVKYVPGPLMPKAEAAEVTMSDLEVHEDFAGQTREYCTKILSV